VSVDTICDPSFISQIELSRDSVIFIGFLGHRICQNATFFLWRYLKSRVHEGKPWTLEDLKTAIREVNRRNRFKISKPSGRANNSTERLETRIRKNGIFPLNSCTNPLVHEHERAFRQIVYAACQQHYGSFIAGKAQ